MNIVVIGTDSDHTSQIGKLLKNYQLYNISDIFFLRSFHDLLEHLIFDAIIVVFPIDIVNIFDEIKQIQSNPNFVNVPILIIAEKNEDSIQSALHSGHTCLLEFPINETLFYEYLGTILRWKESLNEYEIHIQLLEKLLSDHTKQLELAKRVQRTVLSKPVQTKQITIDARYLPSEQLSGDLYYWLEIDPGRYGVILIDVVGHGISASLISMSIRSLLRGLITRVIDPVKVVHELNKHMHHIFSEHDTAIYFSALYLIIDTNICTIEYVNAGHPPGIVKMSDNTHVELTDGSFSIGLFPKMNIKKGKISYQGNTSLIIFSDGIMGCLNDSLEQTILTMKSSLEETIPTKNISFTLDAIINKCCVTGAEDDICLIGIHLNG